MQVNSQQYRLDFFILLFATFAMAIVGDNATETLILSRYSSELVSRMFSINAVILFLFSLFSMALVDKFNRAKLFQAFLFFYGTIIFAAWYLAELQFDWIYIPLYSLGYSGKILSFFFVWTMANDISDARRGLRDFPIIASGGTLGAIVTTFSIPWIVSRVEPNLLLLFWLLPLLVTILLANQIGERYPRYFARRREGSRRVSVSPWALISNLKILYKEPLLAGMAVAYFLIFFLVFNQQYLFYTVLKERLSDAVSISRFLGYFTGASLLITFFLQLVVAGPVTRKLGVIRTLYLLPLGLVVAFMAVLISSDSTGVLVFEMVIAGLAIRIAFFDSFFSPSYQNFFSSLPANVRGNSKLVIDGVVKPLAMICSTVWILFVDHGFFSYMILTVVAVSAMIVVMLLKKRYIATLLKYLSRYHNNSAMSISEEAQIFRSNDGLKQLEKILDESIYEVQKFAVDLLVTIDSEQSIDVLMRKFYHRSGELQAYIATVIKRSRQESVIPFLHDVLYLTPYPRVIANTIWTLGKMGRADTERVVGFMKSETPRIRGNCVVILARSGDLTEEELDLQLRAMLFHHSENIQATGLWAISQVTISERLKEDILQFWRAHDDRIIGYIYLWRQFLAVITSMGDMHLLLNLLRYYDRQDELKQQVMLSALVQYGRKHGLESLIMLEHDVEGEARGVVFEALACCDQPLPSMLKEQVIYLAEQEFLKAVTAREVVRFLGEYEEPEMALFRDIVIERELSIHLRNLFACAILMDQSGKLRPARTEFLNPDWTVNSRIIEVVDTIRSNRVNQLIVSLSEKRKAPRRTLTLKDIYFLMKKSSSRFVKEYIEYLQERGFDGRQK